MVAVGRAEARAAALAQQVSSLERSLEVAALAAREEERVKLDAQAEAHRRALAEAAARLAAAEAEAREAAEARDAAREEAADTRDRLAAAEEGLLHARAADRARAEVGDEQRRQSSSLELEVQQARNEAREARAALEGARRKEVAQQQQLDRLQARLG